MRGLTIAANDGSASRKLACDAVLMAGGWTPSVHLWSHSLGSLIWSDDWGAYLPDKPNEKVRCVGACAGRWNFGSGIAIGELPSPKPLKRAPTLGLPAAQWPRGHSRNGRLASCLN